MCLLFSRLPPCSPGVTYSQFNASFADNLVCPSTCLRPDPGGALIPWLYTVILLLFHLPACIIRAVRWESAQYLALGLALFNIAITIQSYVSTKLDPAQVLVWMPLTLMLDIGAMLQMVILILEKKGNSVGELANALLEQSRRIAKVIKDGLGSSKRGTATTGEADNNIPMVNLLPPPPQPPDHSRMENNTLPPPQPPDHSTMEDRTTATGEAADTNMISSQPQPSNTPNGTPTPRDADTDIISSHPPQPQTATTKRTTPSSSASIPSNTTTTSSASTSASSRAHYNLVKDASIALFAAHLLIILLTLQIYGLTAATRGMKTRQHLTCNWCSPLFRNFAVAVTTGNCERYLILDSSSNGIGCIQLPASSQEDWLKGTVAALSVSLGLETLDLILVRSAKRTQKGKNKKFRGTRLRRPWLSMFGGALTLILLISYGADMANHLPPGVTDAVWIYRKEPRAEVGRVCRGELKSPGLRGMIIGWTDGLFNSWGTIYHGKVVRKAVNQEL